MTWLLNRDLLTVIVATAAGAALLIVGLAWWTAPR